METNGAVTCWNWNRFTMVSIEQGVCGNTICFKKKKSVSCTLVLIAFFFLYLFIFQWIKGPELIKNLGILERLQLSKLLALVLQFDKISGALLQVREILLRHYLGAWTQQTSQSIIYFFGVMSARWLSCSRCFRWICLLVMERYPGNWDTIEKRTLKLISSLCAIFLQAFCCIVWFYQLNEYWAVDE